MPPRSRARRSAAVDDESIEAATPARRGRTRGAPQEEEGDVVDVGNEEDAEGEAVDDELEEEDAVGEVDISGAGPSRRAPPGKGRGGAKSRGRAGKRQAEVQEDEVFTDMEGTPAGDDPNITPKKRSRKSVSYKEIPPGEGAEEDAEGEEDVSMEVEGGGGEDEPESPGDKQKEKQAKPTFEKVGSGRGGFSVKGAAAAAARARWDKVRREKAERGDDSDDDKPRRRAGGPTSSARNKKPSDDTPATGTTVMIKNKEYVMGEDELILPDNEKGDTKIDVDGNLKGGREFKMYTYTSEARPNPNRRYALTIDVARACGYTDSLAFLRRVPQIVKLSCLPSERDILIEKGRVTGNLKHRMVTMVAVRNIFKLLGAKVIKDGKWVTDDYDEEAATAKCKELEIPPGSIVQEEEIQPQAVPTMLTRGDAAARAANLLPFYSVGGPTTHFGGNGANPAYDAGWGHKRAKLRAMGVTEEDWMFRTAEESRRIDKQLREFREDRIVPLEGEDAKLWTYAMEDRTDPTGDGKKPLVLPSAERSRIISGGRGVKEASATPAVKDDPEGLTPLPSALDGDVNMEADAEVDDGVERTPGGKIVVETEEERKRNEAKYNWGLGSWQPGVVKAAYEPHTHMPHVPLYTQSQSAAQDRLSLHPLIASYADSKHQNFVQSSLTGPASRGLASVEYVLETRPHQPSMPVDGVWELYEDAPTIDDRLRAIAEAEEWERASRKRQKLATQTPAP